MDEKFSSRETVMRGCAGGDGCAGLRQQRHGVAILGRTGISDVDPSEVEGQGLVAAVHASQLVGGVGTEELQVPKLDLEIMFGRLTNYRLGDRSHAGDCPLVLPEAGQGVKLGPGGENQGTGVHQIVNIVFS